MNKFLLIGLISVFISCVSQVLLKSSSMKDWGHKIREYINPYVILGYVLLALCMLLTIYMYKGIELKYGAVIESLGFIIMVIFGRLFFKEKITTNKIAGNVLIVLGIIVFNLI